VKILFVVQNIDFIDPIGMMMMSALARKKGHRTRLAVISRENLLDRKIEKGRESYWQKKEIKPFKKELYKRQF